MLQTSQSMGPQATEKQFVTNPSDSVTFASAASAPVYDTYPTDQSNHQSSGPLPLCQDQQQQQSNPSSSASGRDQVNTGGVNIIIPQGPMNSLPQVKPPSARMPSSSSQANPPCGKRKLEQCGDASSQSTAKSKPVVTSTNTWPIGLAKSKSKGPGQGQFNCPTSRPPPLNAASEMVFDNGELNNDEFYKYQEEEYQGGGDNPFENYEDKGKYDEKKYGEEWHEETAYEDWNYGQGEYGEEMYGQGEYEKRQYDERDYEETYYQGEYGEYETYNNQKQWGGGGHASSMAMNHGPMAASTRLQGHGLKQPRSNFIGSNKTAFTGRTLPQLEQQTRGQGARGEGVRGQVSRGRDRSPSLETAEQRHYSGFKMPSTFNRKSPVTMSSTFCQPRYSTDVVTASDTISHNTFHFWKEQQYLADQKHLVQVNIISELKAKMNLIESSIEKEIKDYADTRKMLEMVRIPSLHVGHVSMAVMGHQVQQFDDDELKEKFKKFAGDLMPDEHEDPFLKRFIKHLKRVKPLNQRKFTITERAESDDDDQPEDHDASSSDDEQPNTGSGNSKNRRAASKDNGRKDRTTRAASKDNGRKGRTTRATSKDNGRKARTTRAASAGVRCISRSITPPCMPGPSRTRQTARACRDNASDSSHFKCKYCSKKCKNLVHQMLHVSRTHHYYKFECTWPGCDFAVNKDRWGFVEHYWNEHSGKDFGVEIRELGHRRVVSEANRYLNWICVKRTEGSNVSETV